MTGRGKKWIFTDPFVRVRGTGDKLQHFRSLLSQTPAIEYFSIAFLKIIKLLGISRIQEPGKIQKISCQDLAEKASLIPNGTLYTFLNARALLREKPSTTQPQLPPGQVVPFVFIMLVTLSLTRITVGQTPEADFFGWRLSPRWRYVFYLSPCWRKSNGKGRWKSEKAWKRSKNSHKFPRRKKS